MSEREIRVCPVCRCADFETARGGFGSRETPTRHSCNCCGERFDEPATRPPKRDGGLRGDSLAAALDDADPDDLVTDGGRDVESSSEVERDDLVCDGCGSTLDVRLVDVEDPDGRIAICSTCEPSLSSTVVREVRA